MKKYKIQYLSRIDNEGTPNRMERWEDFYRYNGKTNKLVLVESDDLEALKQICTNLHYDKRIVESKSYKVVWTC